MRGGRRLPYADAHMKNLLLTLLHLAIVAARLCGPGGLRSVIAENLLLRQQLIVLQRARISSRRLVGFGVQCGAVTGVDMCRMFNAAVQERRSLTSQHRPRSGVRGEPVGGKSADFRN